MITPSTTSAHPDRLDRFVVDNAPHGANLADAQRSIAGFQLLVSSRSPDFRVDVPALATLTTLLESMGATESFVATVRDELLAADGADGGVAVAVDTAGVRVALDRAGVDATSGPIEFAPATLYGLPPTSGFVDDPICAANGNMIHADLDLAFPGIAAVLDVRRTYNSLLTRRSGAFGAGVSSIFDATLVAGDDRVMVELPDGATAVWIAASDRPGGGPAAGGRRLHRVEADDDGWTVYTDERSWYRFDTGGILTGWCAGVAQVSVERDAHGRIVECCERVTGRRVRVGWADGRITEIVTDDGRSATYTYDADAGTGARRLVRVATECGHLEYDWVDGLLASVVDPDGVRPFRNEYDELGRVTRQTSAFGRITTYRYEATGLTVITDRAGTRQAMVHDRRGNLTAVIDADGSAMRITYDHDDRAVRVVERDGATWQHEFDPVTGRLVGRTDPDGLEARWTWDEHGRVRTRTDRAGHTISYDYAGDGDAALTTPVRIAGPDGAVTRIEVDARLDRPLVVTDPDGVTMRYEYDGDGQLVAAVDALGGRTELGYDEAGRLARRLDPLGSVTRLTHVDGRLVAYERGGDTGTFDYSPAGRVTAVSTSQETARLTLGEHGAPVAVTDADGNTVTLSYDEIGNISAVTTADGETFHQFHDEVGRLVGTADPTGATAHRHHDRAGRMVEFVDAEGRPWRRDVDPWGRTVRAVGPDGATTAYTYHPTGEVATVALPDGRVWACEVDHGGRVTGVTAPDGSTARAWYSPAGRLVGRRTAAGRTVRVEYDPAGRPAAVTDAAGRRTTLERDAAGHVTTLVVEAPGGADSARHEFECDPAGRVVAHRRGDRVDRYAYDSGGRLVGHTDGTGATRTCSYDARGLLSAVTDAAGGTIRYGYDPRGRLVSQTTPGDRTTTFGYDQAGRLAEVVDPVGVVCRLDRDATGALIAHRIGDAGWRAALDAVGRVTGFTGADGVVLAEFGYDPNGRLTSASVDGWIEEFGWSATDRRVSVTTPDGTTHLERDADGWTVGVTRPDGTYLGIDRDSTGRILAVDGVAADRSAPVERDLAGRLLIGADGTAFHYDDAGRLARIEHPDGTGTRYEFDADGLRVREHTALGVRSYRYDPAARLVATSTDGGTTRYEYDDVGCRVAEHHPDGSRVAYRWSAAARLVAIVHIAPDGTERHTTIVHDAFGRPVRVGGQPVATDRVPGLPSLGTDPVFTNGPGAADGPEGVGALTFLGARVHDAATGQFLSPDPLLPVPGTPGAASPYTYGWHDPVNFVDPSGRRPIGRDEWQAIREREEHGALGAAWRIAADDPWGSIAAAAVVVVGAGLMFTPFAPIGGGILLGAAVTAGVGVATGTFDPRQVALGGVVGGVGGGIAQGARLGVFGTRTALAANGALGAVDESAGRVLDGQWPDPWDCTVAFGLSVGTARLSDHLEDSGLSLLGRMTAGGATSGTSTVLQQVLTGRPLETSEVYTSMAIGTAEPALGVWADRRQPSGVIDGALALTGRSIPAAIVDEIGVVVDGPTEQP